MSEYKIIRINISWYLHGSCLHDLLGLGGSHKLGIGHAVVSEQSVEVAGFAGSEHGNRHSALSSAAGTATPVHESLRVLSTKNFHHLRPFSIGAARWKS